MTKTKNPVIKVGVIGRKGNWSVQFNYGVQYFTIPQPGSTYTEARWMARMLEACFEHFSSDLIKHLNK